MVKKIPVFLSLFVIFTCAIAFGADKYSIDLAHSNIGFSVKHLMIAKVKGQFKDFSGTINYDAKNYQKSSVEVKINVASIDTGIESRDNHLKNPDFFDIEKYPHITFVSTKIKKGKDGYVAIGDFTMRGIKKKIELPFKITDTVKDMQGNMRFGVEAQITIDRRDWGLTWSKTLETGGLVVSHDVEIDINVQAVKK